MREKRVGRSLGIRAAAALLCACLLLSMMPTVALADTPPEAKWSTDDAGTWTQGTFLGADGVSIEPKLAQTVVYLGGAGRADANDGSSPEHAVATVNRAVALAEDGGTIVVCGDTTVSTKLNIEGKSLTFTNTDGVTAYHNPILSMNRPYFAANVTLRGVTWKQEGGNPYCTVGKNATLTLDTVTPVNIQYIQGDTGARLVVLNSTLTGVISRLLAFDSIELDHSSATALEERNYFLNDASDFILKNGSTLSVSKYIKSLTSVGEGNTLQARKLSGTPVPVSVAGPISIDDGKPLNLSSYWKTADARPFLQSDHESLTLDKFTLGSARFALVKHGGTLYAADLPVAHAPTDISSVGAILSATTTKIPTNAAELLWWKVGDEERKTTVPIDAAPSFSTTLSEILPDTAYAYQARTQIDETWLESAVVTFRTLAEQAVPPTGSISGSVTNNTGGPCSITVTIEEGNTVRATQVLGSVTDNTSSSFSFSALPDGFYNVVADNGAYKVTRLVKIKGGEAAVDVELTLGKTQSVVEIVTPDTPPAAVDGLPEQFEEQATDEKEGYTDANAGVVRSGGTVELKLTVERKSEGAVSGDAELITAAAVGQTIPIYLDLSVIKTVTPTSGSATETTLTSVPKLLTVVLPLPDEAAGKQNITVYRVHNGAAEALPKADPGENGEWAEISGGNAILRIRQFSTYAVAYDIPAFGGGDLTAYTITATAGEGGSISPNGKVRVNYGGKKSFTITPNEGYEISDVLVDGKSVGAVNGYVFESVKASHTIAAAFQKADSKAAWNPFEDVQEDDWFHDEVKYAYENGLMVGTTDTEFSPYLDTSRGMMVTILWRLVGSPPVILSKAKNLAPAFPDVPSGQYYTDAVAWGAENEIVMGYDNGNFGPNHPITREQLCAILWRYAKYKGVDVSVGEGTNILSYPDFGQISKYAIPAMQWACGTGILQGKGGGVLDPRGYATRSETAAMLQRFTKGGGEPTVPTHSV